MSQYYVYFGIKVYQVGGYRFYMCLTSIRGKLRLRKTVINYVYSSCSVSYAAS